MDEGKIISKTWSLCPICLNRIPADRIQIGKEFFLRKTCKEHGAYQTIIWRGYSDFNEWLSGENNPDIENPQCPDNCGLCSDHIQKTCCVLLNITNNCNLNCNFCFADQDCVKTEPTFEEIRESLSMLIEKGKTLVQLSGGEPTTRKDLPEIIKIAKEAGAKYVQLNTNGILLGEDKQYVQILANAGLSFVFMQFDGTNDTVFETLRGKPLLKIKQQAIENCAACNIGVTLVPTLVSGTNTNYIGDILRYAISNSPKVRGVHFQPVTYTGRTPEYPTDSKRFTLDELVYEICNQTNGIINSNDLLPSACDHPLCGFHGDFIVDKNKLIPLLNRDKKEELCCCDSSAADRNREFVAKRWLRNAITDESENSSTGNIHDMEYFLKRVKTHGFTVSAMAFQDAGNVDLIRLQQCSFHVYDKGKFVPFCAYYLSEWQQ